MFKHAPPVLIADDDAEYTTYIVDFLRLVGFTAVAAYSLTDAFRRLQNEEFDLAVISADLSLPPIAALCRDVSSRSTVPLLIQNTGSECLFSAPNVIVTEKTHSAKALLNKIEKSLEELEQYVERKDPLKVGPLHISVSDNSATLNGKALSLTTTEFDLLEYLASHVNQPVTKDVLYQRVLGRVRQNYDRSVDVHISSLRHKLDVVSSTIINIQSIRGVGYRLNINLDEKGKSSTTHSRSKKS